MFYVDITTVKDKEALAELRSRWESLAVHEHNSVFLSWQWIKTWAEIIPDNVKLHCISLTDDGELVAMGLLTEQHIKRNIFVNVRALSLHSCLLSGYEFMIEHNDFVTKTPDPRYAEPLMTAICERLEWDEFYANGVGEHSIINALPGKFPSGCRKHILKSSQTRYVNLSKFYGEPSAFLSSLKRKTRYKINQYVAAMSCQGELSLEVATTKQQALDFFKELKPMHQAYWVGRNRSGSFANTFWEKFHVSLIQEMFEVAGVQLARIKCGDKTIGVIYSLVKFGHIYMIQSGYNYKEFAQHHPGYLSLLMLIQKNIEIGSGIFDFLAGDAQYKKSFSTDAIRLDWIVFQRPRMRLLLESSLKKIKRFIFGHNDDVNF